MCSPQPGSPRRPVQNGRLPCAASTPSHFRRPMELEPSSDFQQRVLATVKSSQERKDPPLIWAMEVSKCVQETGLGLPNPELGQVLVSNLCFTNNNPMLWKFIEHAIGTRLLSSVHVLALLTSSIQTVRLVAGAGVWLMLVERVFGSRGSCIVEMDGEDGALRHGGLLDGRLHSRRSEGLGMGIIVIGGPCLGNFGDGLQKFVYWWSPADVSFLTVQTRGWILNVERVGPKGYDDCCTSNILLGISAEQQLGPRAAFGWQVIPHRRSQPEAYRLYLELLSQYAFPIVPMGADPVREKIIKSIDDALQLSHTYGVCVTELGHATVLYGHQDMDIDAMGNLSDKRNEQREQLRRVNAFTALEVVEKLTENRKAMVLLRLVHLNIYRPEKFNGLLQRLQFLEAHKSTSPNLTSVNQILVRLSANIQRPLRWEYQLNERQTVRALIDVGSCSFSYYHNFGSSQSACWFPFDMYMENAMDGRQLPSTSAADIITGAVPLELYGMVQMILAVIAVIIIAILTHDFLSILLTEDNSAPVLQESDPLEGPIPHLDARMCVLLSIIPMAIVRIVEEEGEMPSLCGRAASGNLAATYDNGMDGNGYASRKQGLISSLQILGQFSGLISPPPCVVVPANNAASKAASFISGFKNGSDGFKSFGHGETPIKAVSDVEIVSAKVKALAQGLYLILTPQQAFASLQRRGYDAQKAMRANFSIYAATWYRLADSTLTKSLDLAVFLTQPLAKIELHQQPL
ncbi:hypothetical protein ACLOJK_031567 [Asimina triloba]